MSTGQRKKQRAAADQIIVMLAERFPKTFVVVEGRRRPLKINIDHDIAVALGKAVDVRELGYALMIYTSNLKYLSRLLHGAWRINLAGEPCGTVSVEEERFAKARLADRAARQKKAILVPEPKSQKVARADIGTNVPMSVVIHKPPAPSNALPTKAGTFVPACPPRITRRLPRRVELWRQLIPKIG
jgi:sRNA-binding protein